MVIGRLSCGRFAPGSGRVVVVRSLRSWLPTRERPLEPLSWHRRLLARPPSRKFSASCPRAPGWTSKQEAPPPGNQWQAPRPLSVPRGLPNQMTARGKASCTHEDPSRRGGLAEPEAANGPWEKQFFLRLSCSPPDTRRPDQNSIIGFAMNRSTLSWCPLVVPALGMRDVHLRARLKIREPFLDSPDQHGLR